MPFALRPYRNRDFQAVERIDAAVYPDLGMHGEWRRAAREESVARRLRCLYVAVETGTAQVVGYGSIEPRRGTRLDLAIYAMDLMVHPEWQRHGIGSGLYRQLIEDLHLLNATAVCARVRSDAVDARAFLSRRDFREGVWTWDLRLSTQDATTEPFRPIAAWVRDHGVRVLSLEEEMNRQPDYLRRLHDLCTRVWGDASGERAYTVHAEPFAPMPFPEFVEWLESEDVVPAAFYVAARGSRYVGLSHAKPSDHEAGCLVQGWTGVRREHRRQGIAIALKIAIIDYARQSGYDSILSRIGGYNAPSLALNEKLGFKRHVGWINMEKRLGPER